MGAFGDGEDHDGPNNDHACIPVFGKTDDLQAHADGSATELELFPNPANERVVLRYTAKAASTLRVDVVNVVGRVVKQLAPVQRRRLACALCSR